MAEPEPPAPLPSLQQAPPSHSRITAAAATAAGLTTAVAAAAAARQRVTWQVPSGAVVGGSSAVEDQERGFDLQDVWRVGGALVLTPTLTQPQP